MLRLHFLRSSSTLATGHLSAGTQYQHSDVSYLPVQGCNWKSFKLQKLDRSERLLGIVLWPDQWVLEEVLFLPHKM